MDRRKFLSGTATTLSALGIGAHNLTTAEAMGVTTPRTDAPESHRRAPNVLILMSDQHRRSCMRLFGDSVAVTPNLDGLARQSTCFRDAYCTNPVCVPSRASIMTGLYSHNLDTRYDRGAFSPKHKTIAHHFSRAGYLTALVGKMHFLDAQTHGFDYKSEFNDWYQYLGPKTKLYADELGNANSGAGMPQVASLWQKSGDPWEGSRKLDNRLGAVAVGRTSKMEEEDHFDSFVARDSIRFLENYGRDDQPFLLISSFLKPHNPFMPAERFAEMFHPAQMKLSPTWGNADLKNMPERVRLSIETCPWTPELKNAQNATEARKRMAYYYSNLAQMDDCAGQVLRALTSLDLDRNTIVVYVSDHGEMLGDFGLWEKFQFYEGSCGVPLMVRIPGGAHALCDTPVSLVSLPATLADLCQVPLSGPNDGKSFANSIRHPDSLVDYGPVFAEYGLGRDEAKYMIRDGNLKYTYWTHDTAELYDLREDRLETHNLANQTASRHTVERLKQKLFDWHRPVEG